MSQPGTSALAVGTVGIPVPPVPTGGGTDTDQLPSGGDGKQAAVPPTAEASANGSASPGATKSEEAAAPGHPGEASETDERPAGGDAAAPISGTDTTSPADVADVTPAAGSAERATIAAASASGSSASAIEHVPAVEQPSPAEQTAGAAASDDAAPAVGPLAEQIAALRNVVVGRLADLASVTERFPDLANNVAEIARLRARDTHLMGRLHDDVTKLRGGELAAALAPVVNGMLKLHDMMVSLGAADDPNSIAGLLRTQLLQTLEDTCGVRPFTTAPGEPFDPMWHTAVKRLPTTDAAADLTVASTLKVGFVRGDGTVVRVAECGVHRLSS